MPFKPPTGRFTPVVIWIIPVSPPRVKLFCRDFAICGTMPNMHQAPEPSRAQRPAWPWLALIIVIYVAIASLYAARREEQEHHRELLGTMWALGLTRPATIEIDLIRAVTKVLLGALAAIPIAWLIVQAMNAAVLGFNAVMRPAHVFASAGVFLLAAGSGVAVMAWRLRQATPIYMLTS